MYSLQPWLTPDGWLRIFYTGADHAVIEIEATGQGWRPAFLDWDTGRRVAQVRWTYPSLPAMVNLRVDGTLVASYRALRWGGDAAGGERCVMRVIIGAVIGGVAGSVVVWVLATWHHWDVLPEDVQAAFSAVIGGALSFAGGFYEHRRAMRRAERELREDRGEGRG